MSDLKKELTNEIIEEFSDINIGEIVRNLMDMNSEKIELVKQYIELLNKK